MDQQLRIPIKTMTQCVKTVTESIEKENTRDQRKIKIATPAISAYASILMRLRIKVGILQNL